MRADMTRGLTETMQERTIASCPVGCACVWDVLDREKPVCCVCVCVCVYICVCARERLHECTRERGEQNVTADRADSFAVQNSGREHGDPVVNQIKTGNNDFSYVPLPGDTKTELLGFQRR